LARLAHSRPLRRLLRVAPAFHWVFWTAEALFLLVLWGVFYLLPLDRASEAGRAFLQWVGPRLRKQRHVLANLRVAFPDRTPEEIEAIAREVWGNFGAVLGEFPHLRQLRREATWRIERVVKGAMGPLADPPRPAILVTGHFANWELTALTGGLLGVPLAVVYAPNSNPIVDRLLRWRRRHLGCELVARDGGVRALLRSLAHGTSVGLIVDTRQDDGEPIPFFGVEAMTTTVPARLAVRHGLELVPVRLERTGPGARFRMTYEEPLRADAFPGDPREQARAMTRALHARFEAWLRERPGEWHCAKRRWEKDAEAA
jgi:KDO2-lipid IV(A) lauroyltransferase